MERHHIAPNDTSLPGYKALCTELYLADRSELSQSYAFAPSQDYRLYHRIHKVYVGAAGAGLLRRIHDSLRDEQIPAYLEVAGWAAAEAALVETASSAVDRIHQLESAEACWMRALAAQETINYSETPDCLQEVDSPYRLALDLAFVPLMKSLVVGDITSKIREQTFVDVLAIAGTSALQRKLAFAAGEASAVRSLVGFEHECNALLGLLYMDDPRYVPMPSSARAGSGRDYPEQTHDLVVINQHWGRILKTTPVEIKASASLYDLKRYDALIVRGKMHLAINGYHDPSYTREAYAAYYDGTASAKQTTTVHQVSATMRKLLQGYARGERKGTSSRITRYYDTSGLVDDHPEFSLHRAMRK